MSDMVVRRMMTRVLLLVASVLLLSLLATFRATDTEGLDQQPSCAPNLAVQSATNAGNLAALQQQVAAVQSLAS